MKTAISTSFAATLFLAQGTASGHEYWLDAVDPSISKGKKIIVDVRNGENFAGSAYPYNLTDFLSIDFSSNGTTEPYTGRLGDYPAIHKTIDSIGLYAVSVNTNKDTLKYNTWEKFNKFLNYHSLDEIPALHQSRNLPNSFIKEHYWRNAKTLFEVTDVKTSETTKADAESHNTANSVFNTSGVEFEMVLLDNPLNDIPEMRVQLFFKGAPLANRQTEMFWRGEQMFRFTQKTNNDGIATFKLLGDGDYLFNAVHLREPKAGENAHWSSLWSSITFERSGFGKL